MDRLAPYDMAPLPEVLCRSRLASDMQSHLHGSNEKHRYREGPQAGGRLNALFFERLGCACIVCDTRRQSACMGTRVKA